MTDGVDAVLAAAVNRDAKEADDLRCGTWTIRRSLRPSVEERYNDRVTKVREAVAREMERRGEVVGFGGSRDDPRGRVEVSSIGGGVGGAANHAAEHVREDDDELFWQSGSDERTQSMLVTLEEQLRLRSITLRSASPYEQQLKLEVHLVATGKWNTLTNWSLLSAQETMEIEGLPDGPIVDALRLTFAQLQTKVVSLSYIAVCGLGVSILLYSIPSSAVNRMTLVVHANHSGDGLCEQSHSNGSRAA